MKFQYLLYFTKRSFMPFIVLFLVINALKGPPIPWLIRPITSIVANKVIDLAVNPNFNRHFALLESYLQSGQYLCGDHLTAADILLAVPLIAARDATKNMGTWDKGTAAETFPKLFDYIGRLEKEAGWNKAADKIREVEGVFYVTPDQWPQ